MTMPRTVIAILIGTLLSGCALMPQRSALSVRVPAMYQLSAKPYDDDCEVRGETRKCIGMLKEDWDGVLDYIVKLIRELEAACVKIGQVRLPSDWQTDPDSKKLARQEIYDKCWAKK